MALALDLSGRSVLVTGGTKGVGRGIARRFADAGATVIVSHGGYRTVYSNLASTSVAKGAKIDAGASLGKARTEGGKGVVHFEVWKVEGYTKTPVDPSGWLSRK